MTGIFPPTKESTVAMMGKNPVMLIHGRFYKYDEDEHCDYWRCFYVQYDSVRLCWYHADDTIYYFDDFGNVVRKEE